MKILIKQNVISFYCAFMLITISTALPHAVLTVLLLSKGISLSQIMLIQAAYSVAILFSEYPSGLLGDMFSKKKLFLLSKVFLLLMCVLIIFNNNFYVIALAWVFYGISTALDSVTIDVEIINFSVAILGSLVILTMFSFRQHESG